MPYPIVHLNFSALRIVRSNTITIVSNILALRTVAFLSMIVVINCFDSAIPVSSTKSSIRPYGKARFRRSNSACIFPPLSGGMFSCPKTGHLEFLESAFRERLLPERSDDEPELGYLPGDFILPRYTESSFPVGIYVPLSCIS